MMEHQGIRWGYVFLRAPNFLNDDDRNDLMTAAVEMYLAGEDERNVEGAEYEGRLYTEQRFEMLGAFGGQRFDVDLDTSHGRDTRHIPGQRENRGLRREPGVLAQLGSARQLRNSPQAHLSFGRNFWLRQSPAIVVY